MEESKPHLIKDNVPIQRGDFEIIQEYVLVDNLEEGIYTFKADFVYQVCADYGLCVPKADQFSKKIKISSLNNQYVLDWENKAADLNKVEITENELRGKLREANVIRLNEVKAVVLETTGDVSVLHGDDDKEIEAYILEDVEI